jgi:hypothetical protein
MHAMCLVHTKNYVEASRMAYETVNMMCAECNRQLDPVEFESMVHLLLLTGSARGYGSTFLSHIGMSYLMVPLEPSTLLDRLGRFHWEYRHLIVIEISSIRET